MPRRTVIPRRLVLRGVLAGGAAVAIPLPRLIGMLNGNGTAYADATPLAQALVAANPDRIVWGTNWPHPGRGVTPTAIAPPYPNDDGMLLNQLPKWVPDAAIRKKILVDNPARLYGFETAL